MLDQITPLLIAYNEEVNLERTLAAVSWARETVVVDSGSTDKTRAILDATPGVRVFERAFDSFAQQCSYGASRPEVETDWILSLDADHVVTPELVEELAQLDPDSATDGYTASFAYCIHGRQLRGSLYPPRVVLFRKTRAQFVDDGHGHRIEVAGRVGRLAGCILHDDRKPLGRWLASQNAYMRVEARKLADTPSSKLGFADRVRKLVVVAPLGVLLYCLIAKGGLLDGRAGWYYALQRMVAEAILSLRLIEARIRASSRDE